MESFVPLLVIVVAGYGIAWMVGGRRRANRWLRFVARSGLWMVGLVFIIAGLMVSGFAKPLAKSLRRVGKRLPKLIS